MDILKRTLMLARSDHCRQCSHRTERTPCARSIDNAEHTAHDSGDKDEVPKHSAHSIPIAPGIIHLYAEHGKNEQKHETSEKTASEECGNRPVPAHLTNQVVVVTATRTDVSTPISTLKHRH